MTEKVKEIAVRIKGIREMLDISEQTMADDAGVTLEEYRVYENGDKDFNFTFLYKLAKALNVDIKDLIDGESPKLGCYTIERAGEGMPINRRKGFKYLHLASNFKNRIAEPFMVNVPYDATLENSAIVTNTHKGQEFDYILEGALKVVIDGHTEILHAGDSIYYDSITPHGMVAAEGHDCKFLAVVFN